MHRRAAGSGQHYTVIVADGRHSSLPTIEILWFVDYFYFFVSFRIEETVCPLLFLLAGIPNSFRADNGGREVRARARAHAGANSLWPFWKTGCRRLRVNGGT